MMQNGRVLQAWQICVLRREEGHVSANTLTVKTVLRTTILAQEGTDALVAGGI